MNAREEPVEPDPSQSADMIADELFVHGLLATGQDNDAARQARVAAVMDAIRRPVARPRRPMAPWLVLAAAAVIAALATWLSLRRPDAATVIDNALRAAATAGDRRFSVDGSWSVADTNFAMRGVLDVRDAQHYLVRATVHGAEIVTGSDGGPPWFAGDAHFAEHLRSMPQEGRGAFVLDRYGLTLGSPDAFVARLPAAYRFEPVREGMLAQHPGAVFHVVAGRRTSTEGVPDRVAAWIDVRTHAVHRLEMTWRGDPGHQPPPSGSDETTELHAGHLVVLDLVGALTLPADWFQSARHR